MRTALTTLATCLLAAAAATASPTSAWAAGVTKGPWVQRVTASTAEIRVEVQPAQPVKVELEMPTHRVVESTASSLHVIPLDGLEPGSRYAAKLRVGDVERPFAFTTAPRDDASASFRFIVYGDNRTDDAGHAAVVAAIARHPTDLLVHSGDFVENGASKEQWQGFFDVEAPLLRDRCLLSAVGNHELTDGAGTEWVRYFGPAKPATVDELASTHRWGSARFFMINGMVNYGPGRARSWLENALKEADSEPGLVWRIVVVHHSPWSSGPHGNNARLLDAKIPALLRAHKVDLIVAGHDHIYERGFADGLAYVISGGGGAPLYRIRSRSPSARRAESVHHFVEVEATPSALRLSAERVDGSTIERCGLVKESNGATWDCDGERLEPASSKRPESDKAREPTGTQSAPAPPATEKSAPSTSRCGCRVVGDSASHEPLALVGGGLGIALLFCRRRRTRHAILRACASRPPRS
ncbi:Purple acid phosphatase [Labilithrix luteola]|uniref:Purple acid phosphatase n=1 Tax=Labilithrix luteola TaxID=1391654 RepID=A0A0K1PKC5_9BACT|nr:metallophosphoesterase [Labilithrix luteola]AKU93993.1 Purple acid phosphatase [Labilithrix luteola]